MVGSVSLLLLLLLILGVCEGFLLCFLYFMFCLLNCYNGYVKDSSGCIICKCVIVLFGE